MNKDDIEIHCSHCDTVHYLPFDDSFENKAIKCNSCNRSFYWHHCPVCETGFIIENGNSMCIECSSQIDINEYFDKGAVAFTGGTIGIYGTNIQIPYRDVKSSKESKLNKSPNLLQFLFYLQCPVCGCWHFPLDGMGKIPIMCRCGTAYYVKCGLYLITFFSILLIGAYLHTFFPAEYKTKLISIIYFILLLFINFTIAPRITRLSKDKE